jgi:hypothetical protein
MNMTTTDEVAYYLHLFKDQHELANIWIHNDIIKKKIAVAYDNWVKDHINQPEMLEPGLEAHVELCLIHPELIRGR